METNVIEFLTNRVRYGKISIYSCSGDYSRVQCEYQGFDLNIILPDEDIPVKEFRVLFFNAYKAAIKDRAENYLQTAKSYQTSAAKLTEQLLNLKIEDI